MKNKVLSLTEAIRDLVKDGDTIIIEGFTHLICHAAGHEIIRQKKRNLTACRLTPDLIYDQMVGAGCVQKLIFSWAGNPGVGPLYALRRAMESQIPRPLEIEEYSHFGMVTRLTAGASKLPFLPLINYQGSDLPKANPLIKTITCPYTGRELATVPALNPDIAVIHAQRADTQGNTQIWGLLGMQKEAAFASQKVIVVVEELVTEEIIRADPNRTTIPGMIVDAVVVEPFGAHPSYAQGYYDRDNPYYIQWGQISKEEAGFNQFIEEWVYGVNNRQEYLKKLGEERVNSLKADYRPSQPVNYGF